MKSFVLMALTALLLCPQVQAAQKKKVLFILTSGAQVTVNGAPVKLGYWGEELSAPLKVLEAAGVKAEFASPDGTALLDPASVNPQWSTPQMIEQVSAADARLKKQPLKTLAQAAKECAVKKPPYDAVLVVGGHGAMFDISRSTYTAAIIASLYHAGKVVAAECHGTGSLAPLLRETGGAPVTGFPDAWESSEMRPQLPYVLQDMLNEASKGQYSSGLKGGEKPDPYVIVSGRIISSRDPMSSEAMGHALLKALAIKESAKPAGK